MCVRACVREDLGLSRAVVLPHHVQGVEVGDGLEGVEGHQGAACVGVEHLGSVPGLKALQHWNTNTNVSVFVRLKTIANEEKLKGRGEHTKK